MNIYYIGAFIIYFAMLLAIGLFAHKKQSSSTDFIMGNRSLNFWVVALSAHASDMSAWLFMGLPAAVFLLGMFQAWIAIGLVVGMFLNWHFIAPKLRAETEKYNCYTLSSYFEKRLDDRSGWLSLISAAILVIFLTHYLSAGMIGMGNLLESLFGINYYIGLSLSLLVVISYTLAGGFVAVAWTDLFQGVFLLIMIVAVPILAFSQMEGWSQIAAAAQEQHISFSLLPNTDFLSFISMLLLATSWGIGYFGMPHVITKFMSIDKVSELKKSKWVGITWQVIVLTAAIAIGLIGIAFFKEGLEDPQLIFVSMVKSLFHPFVAGFILCAVLAASMSTMDSQILVCASVISEDLYPRLFKKEISPSAKLRISRLSVLVVSFFALLLCLNKSKTIMDTVSYSWAGLGSAFGPLVLCSLYSKHINRYGAIAGVIAGGALAMMWPEINERFFQVALSAMIPGFAFSLMTIYIVSLLTTYRVKKIKDHISCTTIL